MNRFGLLLVIAVFSSGPSCGQVADRIYQGGDIVTVNDAQSFAEAVAVKDGKILAVGSLDELAKHQGAKTEIVDLSGQALLLSKTWRFTDAGHREWFLECESSGEYEESTRLR